MIQTNPDGHTHAFMHVHTHAHTPKQNSNSYVSLYCKRARQKGTIFMFIF